MTPRQKIELRLSEVRTRLNDIAGLEGDAFTDEIRAELGTLKTEFADLESRHQAAIIGDGLDEARARGAFGPEDGEAGERGRLLRETTLADYLAPAASGAALQGRAAELNAALEAPLTGQGGGIAVPWAMLETRAFTATAANDGPEMQRPILQRLFGPGVLDTLGVRMDSVPAGRVEWPLISSGAAPAQAKEEAGAAGAVTAGFTFANLKPKRLTGQYEFTHEVAASVAEVEQALRRDLADAIKSKMSDLIINGVAPTNAAPQNVQGFLAAIAAPGDAGATATYADYAGAHASGIDGLHAEMETEVSSVIGTDVYRHAATVYPTSGLEAGSEALKRRSGACRASSYIPDATNAGQSKGNLFHLSGPNGGGVMRGDSVAAMWPTLELVRDIFSKASQGVVLTWITLWDARVAFRSAAYQRVAFKIT